MSEYSKFNIVYRLQKWMDSVPGQTFLNYAYSWGASIVILGTLFKLTHLPGANIMLFLGMGTEVFVFFISAFDRPFDKTQEGMNIPSHVTEEYLEDGMEEKEAETIGRDRAVRASIPPADKPPVSSPTVQAPVAMEVPPSVSPDIVEAQNHYIDELKKLVDTLGKVNDQSIRLTRDSEEMENLNRTLTGISKVYEMQLKGASQQIGTIDQINEQSRKLAEQIEQLNKIYARMIEAMTVNMQAGRTAGPAEG